MPERKYYTLESAAQILEHSEDDLKHFIETGQITPSLYSNRRKYIVLTHDEAQQLVAHAICSYTGLISVHSSWTKSLWEKGEIKLNRIAHPFDMDGIENWQAAYPFECQNPRLPFEEWVACDLADIDNQEIRLLPLPEEAVAGNKAMREWVAGIGGLLRFSEEEFRKCEDAMPIGDERANYRYDFTENGLFTLADIRLSSVNVEGLRRKEREELSPPLETFDSALYGRLAYSNSKSRCWPFDPIAERLYIEHMDLTVRQRWELLKRDVDQDAPKYDVDSLLTEMSLGKDGVEVFQWLNSGKYEETKFGDFEKLSSKIKRFYSEQNKKTDSLWSGALL